MRRDSLRSSYDALAYMEREPFMTVEEVAAYLRVDKYTIYRLVSKGKIPGFKVGHQWRFKQSMLERWLRSHTNIRESH